MSTVKNFERPSDGVQPATPYLYIPKNEYGLSDIEMGELNDTGWIEGPAIFLINVSTLRFESAPRNGVSYRLLVLVGNAGDIPSQNAFVEFNLQNTSFSPSVSYNTEPMDRDASDVHLGIAALFVAQSNRSRKLAWSLSPKAHRFNWSKSDFELQTGDFVAIVKVSDQMQDRAPIWYEPLKNRHDAARYLLPIFDGLWEGIEEGLDIYNPIGVVRLEVNQRSEVEFNPVTRSYLRPRLEVKLDAFQDFPDQAAPLNQTWGVGASAQPHFSFSFTRPQAGIAGFVLIPNDDETLEMRTFVDLFTYLPRGRAILRKVRNDSPLSKVSRALLDKINMVQGTTWPQTRTRDFDFLKEAIKNI